MKAVHAPLLSTPCQLTVAETPEPVLNAGEVLVHTYAAGINPIDWKTCSGGGVAPTIKHLPFIPGWEFSGQVIACGTGVTGFNSGDTVCGFIRFPEPAGCMAEYISVPASQVCLCPDSCDKVEMAALPLAGLTAWQALFDKGRLQAKQRVLVLAAAGGVGHLAVQLARWAGAYVIGTASAAKQQTLLELGCNEAIDYQSTQLAGTVANIDLIIDAVGGATGEAALACLAPGGTLVTLPSVTKEQLMAAGVACHKRVLPMLAVPDQDQLQQLVKLVEQGTVKVMLSHAFAMEEAQKAFTAIASGHTQGKTVIQFMAD